MKTIKVRLRKFRSDLAARDEYLMVRPKHFDKIKMECTWDSTVSKLTESDWLAWFPNSTEVIVVRDYRNNKGWELSIERIQNGKTIEIYKDASYYEWASSDEEVKETFEEFERRIELFEKKGFQVIEPQ